MAKSRIELKYLHIGLLIWFYSSDSKTSRKKLIGRITTLGLNLGRRDCDDKIYQIEVEVDERYNKPISETETEAWDGEYQLLVEDVKGVEYE